MERYSFCPECNIGLNSIEMELCFCQNCKADWEDDGQIEDDDKTSYCPLCLSGNYTPNSVATICRDCD